MAEGLQVKLDFPLPDSLRVGRATAVFCFGTCFHTSEVVEEVEIIVEGIRHRPTASRMPRLDLYRSHGEVRCYRSGFWGTVPIDSRDRPGRIELHVAARLASGAELVAPLGRIEVIEASEPPSYEGPAKRADCGLIAICMTTFDPDIGLFRTQIESLRAQTDTEWICLISDDCSQPEYFDELRETVAADPRFVVSRSQRRLGFYRNFERALELAPAEAELVALCDQDDYWYPEKLEVLRNALGGAQLVYSDQRLVDAEGRVLRETLWRGRRNNHTNLASLLIANTITGAATLFRREVAELALPFPETPGWQIHDHWLGLVALATGEIAYVDRPLYDYVQHAGAIFGHVAQEPEFSAAAGGGRRRFPSLRRWRSVFRGWRAAYFYGYVVHEVQAQVLLARFSTRLTPHKRRALRRFLASAHSPGAFVWLATRPLRGLFGLNETLGGEAKLAKGVLWRWLVALRARRPPSPHGAGYDASFPDLDSLKQRRLRRWRGRARRF